MSPMPNLVSDSVLARLKELREEGAWPVKAIKAVHLEYGISLAEAKRLFSISPAWRGHVEASRPLQEDAIALAERSSIVDRNGGT